MTELMAGARRFRRQIAAIVGVDRGLERHAAGDLDTGLGEAVDLGRIVGEQHHPVAAEHLQHADRDAVVALVIVEAERGVGVHRVEAAVLKLVGAHLVGETDAAAFLREIEDDAAAGLLQPRQRKLELIAAIAAPRAEHVAGETGRMDAHRHRLGEVRLADDHRDRAVADSVAKHHEPRPHAGAERHMRLAGDGERLRGLLAEPRHRGCLDGDDGRIEGAGDCRGGFGNQHRGQNLSEFDQLDGRNCRRAGRLRNEFMIGRGIGDQRENHLHRHRRRVPARPVRRRATIPATAPAGRSAPAAARSAHTATEMPEAGPC